jgi:serine protease Do
VSNPEAEGLLVRFVEEDSPAGRAGIERGDLIVEAEGSPVADPDDLQRSLEALAQGASIELKVLRGTEERTVSVTPSA